MVHPSAPTNASPPNDPPAQVTTAASQPERRATFSDVLADREYRGILCAGALSWLGDYLAKAAVTALVFDQTRSAGAAAATFAISFAPWLLLGPLLSAVADRYPYRNVMIVSDVARMVLIALVAVPGLPLPVLIGLLFLTALGNPPYDSARSALLSQVFSGDRLVLGISLNLSLNQTAQIVGYLAGGVLAALSPRLALGLDAATFAVSALVLWTMVAHRPAVNARSTRRNLVRETGDGFAIVFGTAALRGIAVLVFTSMLFAIVPEGLAVVWAHHLEPNGDPAEVGFNQGLIMLASPVGYVLGGLLVGRLIAPETRRRLIRPLALVAALSLVPALADPPLFTVCVMAAVCGFCIAGMMPAANGLFVQALPNQYRARAFGVMQTGVQLLQGASVLVTGMLANHWPLHQVIGLWSVAGVVLILVALSAWPAADLFTAAIERARRLNEAPVAG
ncbi:MFS transporter [Catellatospora sp. KI3]|uniref:MFS transporter n=1 Tax=Catellatospora sp. KI3 TaxID=3041620 RepID=UPI0024831F53|nr:MFS transporter [Catellatospora sp. KI3]MDI1464347.1 MFS transporter [Catellatospora sp. KI3]